MTPAEIRKAHADAKLIDRLGFTPAQAEEIRSCVNAVWNEVAYDLLTSVAEEKNKNVNSVTVSRSVVIEVSLDAGRPEELMKQDMRRARAAGKTPVLDEADIERWDKVSYEDKIAFVKPVFNYARYGV